MSRPWRLRNLALPALAVAVVCVSAPATPAALGGRTVKTLTPMTLYVDQRSRNCSDGGPGTAAQPFCRIGPASARVIAGQTVRVSPGTYRETVTVSRSGAPSAPIKFLAGRGGVVSVLGFPGGGASGFHVTGRSYLTIQGFSVKGTGADGIVIKNSAAIVVRGNHVSYAGQPAAGKIATGIRLEGVSASVVAGNTVDHNTNYGIYLQSGSTQNRIVANRVFRNARGIERGAAGIQLLSSPANMVSGNISHDNEDSGIGILNGSNNTLICDNVVYDNGDHGIDSYGATGQRILANTVYKNAAAGINVESGSTGATIANNISAENGVRSPRTHGDIRVESGSTFGTSMDYNLVNRTPHDTILVWDSVSYLSVAAFRSATGQEAHGRQGDPRFRNASGDDFHLTARSPAIDSANSGVSGEPRTDVEGNPRRNDLSIPNTGAGPRKYDDRGAYEFRRSKRKNR